MLKSYYRRYVMRAWGSIEWLHAFIAMGRLPILFVDIMRKLCAERKALPPAQGPPRQQKRAQRTEPEKGIQHKTSEPKGLREWAKRLDKEIEWQASLWAAGDRRNAMPWKGWQRLVADANEAWEVAHKASYDAGYPFLDRDGVRRCDEPRDLVGLALREWCKYHSVEYK